MAKKAEPEVIEAQAIERVPAEQNMAQQAVAEYGSPLDMPVEAFKQGLSRRRENRTALVEWVRDSLVEGVDFGRIHTAKNCPDHKNGITCTNPNHFSKPSLWKPGSEKIIGMMGVTATFPSLLEYEKAAYSGQPIHDIILRCEIIDSRGHVVASGVGGRAVEKDYGDLNKCLKMVAKSAAIDATLRLAGLSEVFTQDIEDMVKDQETASESRQSAQERTAPSFPSQAAKTAPAKPDEPATTLDEVSAVINLAMTMEDLRLAEPLAARLPTKTDKDIARTEYKARRAILSEHGPLFLDLLDQIKKADSLDRLQKVVDLAFEMPTDMQEYLAKRADSRATQLNPE